MDAQDKNPFLRVRNLTKKYGDAVILNTFNADIEQGELVTFIGPMWMREIDIAQMYCRLF